MSSRLQEERERVINERDEARSAATVDEVGVTNSLFGGGTKDHNSTVQPTWCCPTWCMSRDIVRACQARGNRNAPFIVFLKTCPYLLLGQLMKRTGGQSMKQFTWHISEQWTLYRRSQEVMQDRYRHRLAIRLVRRINAIDKELWN